MTSKNVLLYYLTISYSYAVITFTLCIGVLYYTMLCQNGRSNIGLLKVIDMGTCDYKTIARCVFKAIYLINFVEPWAGSQMPEVKEWTRLCPVQGYGEKCG